MTTTLAHGKNLLQLLTRKRIGETVQFRQNIRKDFHGDQLNAYLRTGDINKTDYIFASTNHGLRPFAVETNDCLSDGFEDNELGIIPLQTNYYLFHAVCDSANKIDVYIFRVEDTRCDTIDEYVDVAFVNLLHDVENTTIPYIMKKPVEHAVQAFNQIKSGIIPQLRDKYCYNPNRIVNMYLFAPSEDGNLQSFSREGQRLIFNSWTEEKFPQVKGKNVHDVSICRAYYAKSRSRKDQIAVDGVRMQLVQREDFEICSRSIPKGLFKGHFVEVSFYNTSTKVIGMVNPKGKLRLFYATGALNEYRSFRINEHEEKLVSSTKRI